MPETVLTPLSFFEVTIDYQEPNVKLWLDRAVVVQALLTALKPWKISVDNVEIITTGKASEQGLKFKLPEKYAAFFFGPALCKFTKDNASWESAEETIQIWDAAFSALAKTSGVIPASQKTAIALHPSAQNTPYYRYLAAPDPSTAFSFGKGDAHVDGIGPEME